MADRLGSDAVEPPSCDGIAAGTACGALPGGASKCCSGSIKAAGRSCADHTAPCVIP